MAMGRRRREEQGALWIAASELPPSGGQPFYKQANNPGAPGLEAEGFDSERGIAWRVADSLALRRFLGYGLTDQTADHSTLSRNRRLIDVETHQEVFNWVLQVLAKWKLLDGKTLGIDACRIRVPTDAVPRRSDLAVRLAA